MTKGCGLQAMDIKTVSCSIIRKNGPKGTAKQWDMSWMEEAVSIYELVYNVTAAP